ncbi:MAG: poly-gamma-glutamate capsule biosynthesis protein CapA/YwtB (metallophosphatase superfamily) [Arenicella sp.]
MPCALKKIAENLPMLMKKPFLILVAILLNAFALLLLLFIVDFEINKETEIEERAEEIAQSKRLKLSFVGDLMCHEPQFTNAKKADGRYDFQPAFRLVSPFIKQADMAFGNLETVFQGTELGREYAGYPTFNTPDSYANALANTGFDLLFTANNHSLDGRAKGVSRTLEILAENGLQHVGTFTEIAQKNTIQIYDLKNIKFSVLAYTEHSNGTPSESEQFMLNFIDTAQVRKDIELCRAKGTEIIVLNLHFGTEYQRVPNEKQKEIVRFAIECGADIIVGQHPHVLQPVQRFVGSEKSQLDTGLVAFSLGNFFSHQLGRYSNAGLILNIELEKNENTGEIEIINYDGIPTYTVIYNEQGRNKHLILNSSLAMQRVLPKRLRGKLPKEIDLLSENQFKNMEQSYADTDSLFGAFNSDMTLR